MRGAGEVVHALQRRSGLLQRLEPPLVSSEMERLREREEEPRSIGVRIGPELKRPLVESCCGRKRVEAECAVAGVTEGSAGPLGELRGLRAPRPGELERACVVVRQPLCVILVPAGRLDPLCCKKMS